MAYQPMATRGRSRLHKPARNGMSPHEWLRAGEALVVLVLLCALIAAIVERT